MKNAIITISILFGLTASVLAATKTVNNPVTPNPAEFAYKLVVVFGGDDHVLDEAEMTNVLAFLQAHLPEQTTPGRLSDRMNRNNNFGNTPRGDMTEERHALREYNPEEYVGKFIQKYDNNGDSTLTRLELTPAMTKIIGLPSPNKKWGKRAIAKNP